ncbi:MAG: hypothetical protein ABSG33_02625 [Candidatus Bathyarchaeia archaeon]|jgi:hypothetical protein
MAKTASIIQKEERCISKGGNSPILYLPSKYFKPGEKVNFELEVDQKGNLVAVLTKNLFNFTCEGIQEFAKKSLEVEYDKVVGGIRVLNAVLGSLTLGCTQSTQGLEPAYVTVSRRFTDINSKLDYERLVKAAGKLKSQHLDAYIDAEGDLDSLGVFKAPTRHGLKDNAEAVEVLAETGRKLDFTITVRLDNRENDLDQVKLAVEELKH